MIQNLTINSHNIKLKKGNHTQHYRTLRDKQQTSNNK